MMGLSLTSLDILKVMQDLEETSNHSVDILKHFVVSAMLFWSIIWWKEQIGSSI